MLQASCQSYNDNNNNNNNNNKQKPRASFFLADNACYCPGKHDGSALYDAVFRLKIKTGPYFGGGAYRVICNNRYSSFLSSIPPTLTYLLRNVNHAPTLHTLVT